MKKISVLIPCYNEEENIEDITHDVIKELTVYASDFDYEIVIIDNCSTDNTRPLINKLCLENKKVKAIFNARNFRNTSAYYGMFQTTGDCTIRIVADFQDPVELLRIFIQKWREGAKIVCGIKTKSKENFFKYKLRSLYYKIISAFSQVEQIQHFTGFALYDREFIEVLRDIKDPLPYLRGMVTELGYNIVKVEYVQPQRRSGKAKTNFFTLYNSAMMGLTAYTNLGLRLATFAGFITAILCIVVSIILFILKLIYWDRFTVGIIPVILLTLLLNSIQLVFIGLLGEYLVGINTRLLNRPLVVEEKRINFD